METRQLIRLKMYNIAFFHLYKFCRWNSKDKFPKYFCAVSAITSFSVLLAINLLVILLIIEARMEIDLGIFKKYAIVPMLIINLLYYLRNKRFLAIEELFDLKPRKEKILGKIFALFYYFLTLGSIVIIGIQI